MWTRPYFSVLVIEDAKRQAAPLHLGRLDLVLRVIDDGEDLGDRRFRRHLRIDRACELRIERGRGRLALEVGFVGVYCL